MAWDRPILTDSGGFQVVSLGELRSDRRGRGDLPLAPRRLAPALHAGARDRRPGGAGIRHRGLPRPTGAAAFVFARGGGATRPSGRTAWAERCVAAHRGADQALFGIIQGGLEPDLRAESTQAVAALPFDGLCIGGLAGDETAAQRRAALDVVVPLLADDPRPRYLMGLGSPVDLLDAVDAGVDLFDSVLPARVARNGTLWVPEGRLNLRNARFLDDPAPGSGGLPLPRLPHASRGPIWRICSAPTSCSSTGSPRCTT